MIRLTFRAIALAALLSSHAFGQDRPDLVVADFEGESYHPWVASGDAFGNAPLGGPCRGRWRSRGLRGRAW